MTTDQFASTTVGAIVAADYRGAAVFERFGIDFCCNGRRSLAAACREAAVDPEAVARELAAATATPTTGTDPASLPPAALIDHIVTVHHEYIRTSAPLISSHLARLVNAHGARHPELHRIAAIFADVDAELAQHMRKEELVLFPYVRDLTERPSSCGFAPSPFGSIENPIAMMEREHAEAGDALAAIRELTHGYETPPDGCTTWRVTMEELVAFERDLHRHVHLENNVLFPAAIRLEGHDD